MNRKDIIASYPTAKFKDIYTLIQQKKEHIDFADLVTPYDGDMEWKERIDAHIWWAKGYTGEMTDSQKRANVFRDGLLKVGGCEVVLPSEQDVLMYDIAQLWDNLTMKKVRGVPSCCHQNSATLWTLKKYTYEEGHAYILCTGFALSEDGFWRSHSWLIHAKPRANVLIETTVPRIAYFGVGMTYEAAERFAKDNMF